MLFDGNEPIDLAVIMSDIRILVVGQTPPPFGGQAVMIEELLKADFKQIELYHVRMSFSDDMDSVGRFQFKKIWVLFKTIWMVWSARVRHGASVLYYPPAGPNKVPVIRDILLLCATRWMFKKVIFHFHAGGVSTFRGNLPGVLRFFFDIAYNKPTLAIRTSELNPDDGEALRAQRSIVVPNGIRDMSDRVSSSTAADGEPLKILFTGVLIPSKGVRVLVEAFNLVRSQYPNVELKLMGRWGDKSFEMEIKQYLMDNGLDDKVEFYGVLSGLEKFKAFASCDIFCFPSYFEAESFGLVIAEAMQFAKPIVSTEWRGIPSVVSNERNGFLVPIMDAISVSEKLLLLCESRELRAKMGEESRRIFCREFSIEKFYERMERAFVEVGLEQQ